MKLLVMERDAADPALWRYGVDLGDGVGEWSVLRHDPHLRSSEPADDRPTNCLWVSAVLLVRMAGPADQRLTHDLDPFSIPIPPPPQPPLAGDWKRATAGRGKGEGLDAGRTRRAVSLSESARLAVNPTTDNV